jgi:hypothetical protein
MLPNIQVKNGINSRQTLKGGKMENNEVLEQTNETENVETQTTEENVDGIELTDTSETENVEEKEEVKTFTQEEVDEIVRKRLARKERDYQKELSKYKNVENVLSAGLGTKTLEESETKLRDFYKEQGVELPESKNGFSDKELQILGNAEAEEILELGLDEAEEEANRLAKKGRQNWNAKEQATFNKLASTLTYEKQKKELKTIGADAKILDSKEFKDFADQFNYKTDIKNIYNLYSKVSQPKETKNIEKMGSMKNNATEEVKDFYSYDESLKYTRADFKKNPALYKALLNSMTKW